MNPPGITSRLTPAARTPESGVARVAGEGRASRAVARALGVLVERILALGPDRQGVMGGLDGVDPASPKLIGLRDALRQVSARSRDGAMLLRVVDGSLLLEGSVADRLGADPPLRLLLERLLAIKVSAITIREGAAPGELLTLGRLLAQPVSPRDMRTPARGVALAGDETPTAVHAVDFADETPRELLRTWSVLVTPETRPTAQNAARGESDVTVSASLSSVLSRIAAARTDDAATSAMALVRDAVDDAQRRGDQVAIDAIVRACLAQLQVVGESGGRLALEGALRLFMRRPVLELLAKQLPFSSDRPQLLTLFARAGDAGVDTLLEQLLETDDALSRRAYFDGIVAMDVGSARLFEALGDSRWFVVRNAAALLGEMGVEHADQALVPLLAHADERIRIAVARALIRLRTVRAMQALHQVIDDPNAEVRRLSAAAFGLAGASVGGVRPPAARIAMALEREVDEDVALEMLAALGRLGSADAVQRLLRLALPPSPDLTGEAAVPRDPWMRIAAMEALVRARGNQMMPVVETLAQDTDPEVASAASALLRG